MTENLKDMMAARADEAPGPAIEIGDVIRTGRRRVWRHRAAGGTAVGAALAAVALVAPMLPFVGGDGDDPAFSDGFGERQISYATGSTIYDGGQAIDVSPHKVEFYVQTDDGFVYAARGGLYFTDGGDSERIGRYPNSELLVADDTGSYVGWVEDRRDASQAVVYDTARSREVFRSPKHHYWPGPGCFGNGGGSLILPAIDGDIAYVCGGSEMSAWNVTTQTRQWTAPHRPGHPGKVWLTDVSDGYLAWTSTEFSDKSGTIVSREPDADTPIYPVSTTQLSPDANYIAGGGAGRSIVFDRTTNQEVDLAMPEYQEWYVMAWLGNDLFTAMGFDAKGDEGNAREALDLLTCDASSATCKVVGQASGRDIIPPTGISYWL